jgi:hypothetical protein
VTLSRIRVTVDASGLSIAYGPWGWPRQHIARPTIISARVDNIRPLRWGGWGYRGSLILFRRAAVVLRAGPGLVLELQGGRRLAITVDDPEGALRLLPAAPPT